MLPLIPALVIHAPPAAAQGLSVTFEPAHTSVVLGAEFNLEVRVTGLSPFNGFGMTISYDPEALTFLPASPIGLQQGCLMTGECSGACGNTFHVFAAGGDSIKVTDILLCNQVLLTGPGTIYKLRFRAEQISRRTFLRIRRVAFFNGGGRAVPVTTQDAVVTLRPLDVVELPVPGLGLELHAEPHRAGDPITFSLDAAAAGEQRLDVHDVTGRLVCRLEGGWQEAGARQVTWDGRDGAGARVPTGVYFATLRVGAGTARARVAVIW